MKALLEKGVDVDCPSDAGSPLIWAAGHDHLKAVELLLSNGANVRSGHCNKPNNYVLPQDTLGLGMTRNLSVCFTKLTPFVSS